MIRISGHVGKSHISYLFNSGNDKKSGNIWDVLIDERMRDVSLKNINNILAIQRGSNSLTTLTESTKAL